MKKRKLNQSATEEVVFDPSARQEYLTGFHKRKVQRAKVAREAAAQKAREERIEDRKKVSEHGMRWRALLTPSSYVQNGKQNSNDM